MTVAVVVGCVIVAIIGVGVLIGGAPFVPTRRKWIHDAMKLAQVGVGDVVVDLGSGDGAVLLAALRCGARRAVGYEINPLLVFLSSLRLRRFRKKVVIKTGDFFRAELPADTTVIYLFQVEKVLKKIPDFIEKQRPNLSAKKLRVVCFGAEIPGRKFVRERGGMSLYEF
ncbi:class I SAM-dependent methyltransferase [Candidatus Saccharibacteria bacterium]|nr:class I SAM-dependent methyltransferase [Candidatus Saccharibacteria bacterium]